SPISASCLRHSLPNSPCSTAATNDNRGALHFAPLPSGERSARLSRRVRGAGARYCRMTKTPHHNPLTTGERERWPDLAGRIEGETHILPIRVYFEDTDCGGVVYHANFVKFCERGRSDFIRLLGVSHQGLANPEQGEPAIFVVRRIEMDYL